ncbi:ORF18 [callitrichine gammaherpesvirus 3]|uniref:ORF18 n=1 Tax=callitrichine gammaherpesvirus 3 TaxID=106331 RepID=Q993J2_9GAMA|nr:ORF18 [callitrichine gammaherpesvirus 3]AAK38226.1 ORF18 [callitrichine gammaherpesvirus 3]
MDLKVIVSLSSRLYTDEIAHLQERLGCILPLAHCHGTQNIASVGLGSVYSAETVPDYVAMYNYLSNCTLAILDEVNVDSLVLTKMIPGQTYALKNQYHPFFQWHGPGTLSVMPPVFGREQATVRLQSNDSDIIFPMVVPKQVGDEILQKILLYTVYSRVAAQEPNTVDFTEVNLHFGSISYLGRHYDLTLPEIPGTLGLALMDNLSLYLSVLTALIPRACLRFFRGLVRHEHHELLNLFQGMVPDEVTRLDLNALSAGDDLTRMRVFMSYLQSLASLFNLGPLLFMSVYSPETLVATCWLH